MTRKIAITARQVTALCKGAAMAGYIPEIVLGDVVVRLVPESIALATSSSAISDLDQEIEEWENAPADRPRMPMQSRRTVLSRSDKASWHTAETEKQRAARHAKVSAQWESDLQNSDLEHREQRVMDQLLSRPVGPQHVSTIALAGPVTVERLALRGFIEITKSAMGEIETLTLTTVGQKALAEIERRRGRGYF